MDNFDSLSKKERERLKKELLEEIRNNASTEQDLGKKIAIEEGVLESNSNSSTQKKEKEFLLLTASSNTGVGLWTSICVFFSSIFGVESKNYTKKMNRVLGKVKSSLQSQISKHPNYVFSDFRIVKESGLTYTGSVIGILKKQEED